MLKDYDLHPAIDKTKCFRSTIPGNLPSEEPPPDSYWVDELYHLCCDVTDTPLGGGPNPFNKHLSSGSSPLLDTHQMRETLYILFRRFSEALDEELGPLAANEKTTLAGMLMEDVDACTHGFLNRALRAVSRLSQPQNPDEYLYRVRQGLIEKAVIGLPGNGMLDEGNEVHTWNRVSVIAEKEELGIHANYKNDLYVGTLSDRTLKATLKKTFERCFTPYELPVLLRDALLNEVAKMGYEGKKEEGYAIEPISRITNAVNNLLPDSALDPHDPESWKKIFTWRPLEEAGEEAAKLGFINFHELKLDFILGNIYQSLIKKGYLHQEQLQSRHLLDYAAHWELCQKANLQASGLGHNVHDEHTYIQQLFQKQQYDQLGEIFETYPTYWKHLMRQLDFSTHTGELTRFLRATLEAPQGHAGDVSWPTKIRYALIVLIAMLSTANRYNEKTIRELSKVFMGPSAPPHYRPTHLSLALASHPNLLSKILEAIDQHKHRWSAEARRAMLFGAEFGMGGDVLTPTTDILLQAVAWRNPQISKELLQFLERHSADDAKISEGVKELFFRSRLHKNIVAYAIQAEHAHPESLQQLLDFIARNSRTIFNDPDLNKLLEIDYAVLHSNPMKFKIVLRCLLSNEIRLSDGTPLSCWFPKAKQTPPSNDPNSEKWLIAQWASLLWGTKDDTNLTNMLLLRISAHKAKLPEPAEQLLIAFVLERLKLLDLSDPTQKKLFEDTVNLPELLCILLPNHLKALQKESEIPQQRLELPPGSVHQAAQSFAGLFHPDDRFKTPSQEIAFIQKWIHALTTPNNGDGNIGSALLNLKSNSDAARFLSENQCWNALFEICYQQIPNMPLPNAAPALMASRCK